MPKRNGIGIELLADPTRRRIIALLAVSACRPSTIARELALSRQATSRQLALLVEADLIECHRSYVDGRVILYQIPPDSRGPITAWLAGTNVGRPIRLRLDDDGTMHEG
jgi:predicted transcriptional regulator